jgi:cellulose synthase/poly-beta-1,6-N-acetylglucosamine synthase-like glycosyltransferase
MTTTALVLILLCAALVVYTYALYPAILAAWAAVRNNGAGPKEEPTSWPTISITVPVYNEASRSGTPSRAC